MSSANSGGVARLIDVEEDVDLLCVNGPLLALLGPREDETGAPAGTGCFGLIFPENAAAAASPIDELLFAAAVAVAVAVASPPYNFTVRLEGACTRPTEARPPLTLPGVVLV